MSHIVEKILTRVQLCFKFHLNRRSTKEVMGFQSGESPNLKTPNLGVLEQNEIWVQPPQPGIKNTMKGKVMASLKSGPC